MAFVVQVSVGESGGLEEVGFGSGFARASSKDGGDLLTDCRTDLLTGCFKQCGEDGREQEFNEGVPGLPSVARAPVSRR